MPPLDSHTGLSLITPEPPGTLAKLVRTHQEQDPEMQSRSYLLQLGQNFAQLINAVFQHPDYMRELPTELVEKETRSWYGLEIDYGVRKEKELEKRLNALRLLSQDAILAAAFIREKHSSKGEERIHQYLRKADIALLVRAGHKIRKEQVENVHKEWDQWNKISNSKKLLDYVTILYSETMNTLLKTMPVEITDMKTLHEWESTVGLAQHCKKLAETLDLPPSHRLLDSLKQSGLEDFAYMFFNEKASSEGILEMAMFGHLLCAMHGQPPPQGLNLPEEMLPHFRACFELQGAAWHLRDESRVALEQEAQKLFPNDPLPVMMWQRTIEMVLKTLSVTDLDMDAITDEQLDRIFPNGEVQSRLKREKPISLSMSDLDAIGKIGYVSNAEKAMLTPLKELIKLKPKELITLSRVYPVAVEWHTVLIDPHSPEDLAALVRRMYETGDPLCRMIGSELTVLAISFDSSALSKDMQIKELLDCESAVFMRLQERSPAIASFVKGLNGSVRHCIVDTMHIVVAYEEDFDDEEENALDEDDEGDERKKTKRTKGMKWKLDEQSLGVAYFLERLNAIDHAGVFKINRWHPNYSESLEIRDDGTVEGTSGTKKKTKASVRKKYKRRPSKRKSVIKIRASTPTELAAGRAADYGSAYTETVPGARPRSFDYIWQRKTWIGPKAWSKFLLSTHANSTAIKSALEALAEHLDEEMMAEICAWTLHSIVELEMMNAARDPLENLEGKIGVVASLDYPFRLLLDPNTDEVAVPWAWQGVDDFPFDKLSPSVLSALTERIRSLRSATMSDLDPDLIDSEGGRKLDMFTTQSVIHDDQLELFVALVGQGETNLGPIVAPKILASDEEIQRQVFGVLLDPDEAAHLALAIIAEAARTEGDERMVKDLRITDGAFANLPASMEQITTLINGRPPLWKIVAQVLQEVPDRPLATVDRVPWERVASFRTEDSGKKQKS